MSTIVGLDIGGANLKAAHASGVGLTVPFELWKRPQELAAALRHLLGKLPRWDAVAVTMTGELCDCYASKSEGVRAILDAVSTAVGSAAVQVWSNEGSFVDVASGMAAPLAVASANWLALAAFAARLEPKSSGLLIDVGSTTTDLIAFCDGLPTPRGRTDPERMRAGELLYRGADRTPTCAVLGQEVAAELFATVLDAHLVLGLTPEDPSNHRTADGRAATVEFARCRLARMLCVDPDAFALAAAMQLARRVYEKELDHLKVVIGRAVQNLRVPPTAFVLAGSGEFLATEALNSLGFIGKARSLAAELGPALSDAACAYAVAKLAGGR